METHSNVETHSVETHCNASLRLYSEPIKFRKKYRIESARLKYFDYSINGAYFVTICIKEHECNFGEIINDKIKLSAIGEIVKNEWLKTPEIRKNVVLDEWTIMPNHLHGVIIINDKLPGKTESHSVETHCNASLQQRKSYDPYQNSFGPQSNNLAAIIRGFKGITTKNIHIAGFANFFWQPRFYDRVIRDADELDRVRAYIFNNPFNWRKDRNNLANLYM